MTTSPRPRSRRGNSAVEFALTLPILVLLLAGVIDLGQFMFLNDALVNAVSQGARAGAMANEDATPTPEDPLAIAEEVTEETWAASEVDGVLTVVASTWVDTADGAAHVRVTGTVPFTGLFGILTLPASVSYESTVYMMYQPD